METRNKRRSLASLSEESDLGLEASRAGKRSSSSSEEKKKLYVVVSHIRSRGYSYSLYALDIPSPHTVVSSSTSSITTTTTTTVNGVPKTTHTTNIAYSVPERFPLKPFLQFTESELPHQMACFRLGSKLYFVGGEKGRPLSGDGKVSFPKGVWTLDLSSPSPSLKQAPSMRTGKGTPLVGFVADGKLFVISGRKNGPYQKRGDDGHELIYDSLFGKWRRRKGHEGHNLDQFEIFDPSVGEEGEWKKPENPPPFNDAFSLTKPVIVGGKAIFHGCRDGDGEFTCFYDIEAGTWSSCVAPRRPLILESQSQFVGGKETSLWYISPREEEDQEAEMPLLIRTNISMGEEKFGEEEEKFENVIKYYFKHPQSQLLTSIAGCLCFIENEHTKTLTTNESHMNVTLIRVSGGNNNGGESAEYLASAHYDLQDKLAIHHIQAAYDV